MKIPYRNSWFVLTVLSVFYAVGVVGHLVPATFPWMLWLTPWFLLLAGGVVAFQAVRGVPPRAWLGWLLPIYLVTFALEAIGVATGAVFGSYHYTTTLGTLLWGVPPVIGWNWVLVVWGVHAAVGVFLPKAPEALRIVAVGLACVAFDFLLEPVAMGLGYWVWHGGEVPLQNYVAWGLIAAAGSWWAGRFPLLPTERVLAGYVVLQAVFFAVLGLSGLSV